jgi:hypothetical protein
MNWLPRNLTKQLSGMKSKQKGTKLFYRISLSHACCISRMAAEIGPRLRWMIRSRDSGLSSILAPHAAGSAAHQWINGHRPPVKSHWC